jgi:hypothetical protein
MKKSFNIQELLHCMSKHHGTKPLHCMSKHHGTKLMHPSLSRAFQKDQEHDLKHPNSVDLKSTNQTKQTNYLAS